MQGVLRELSDQLRQIKASSAAELAEIKQSIAARAFSSTNGEEAPHLSVEPNLRPGCRMEASLPSLSQNHKPTEKLSATASVSSSGFSLVMEGSGELTRFVEAYVEVGRSKSEQAVSLQELASLLKKDIVPIESLVREMKLYLTTTDHISQSRGVLLLGELVSSLSSKTMEKATIHNLTVFFVDRLADLRAQRGALVGDLALMRRKGDVGMVTIGDAKTVIQSFKKNLNVQTQGQHDRMLCFELLECLLKKYPKAVMSLANDIFYLISEAAEYEKDPDCLLHVFHIGRFVCQLFSDSSGPLDSEAEVRSTRINSLKFYRYCALNYGADKMGQNAAEIWCSLKREVPSSLQELVFSFDSMGGLGLSDNEITKEALAILAMVVAQNTDLYLELLIKDIDINMIFINFTAYKELSSIPLENKPKLYGVRHLLPVTAKSSISSCNKVFEHFFPKIIGTVGVLIAKLSGNCFLSVEQESLRTPDFGPLNFSLVLLEYLIASSNVLVTEICSSIVMYFSVSLIKLFSIFTGDDDVRSESNQCLNVKSLCFWYMSTLQMPCDPGKTQ